MVDYDKIIKFLRVEPFEMESEGLARKMNEAADVIEELLKYKDIFEMMRSVGGIWGFGQDGRLYHLEVKPPEGSGSVRVFPAETGRPDTDGIHKFWEES